MNILFSAEKVNIIRKTIASVAFAAVVLVSPAVSAQTITAQSNTPAITNTKSANKFQAVIFPVENSVNMKINFVNPEEENVTVMIYDRDNTTVYQKIYGKNTPLFRGKFDLSMLADGDYTVKVKSSKESFTRKISIKTQKERITSAI